MASVVKLRTRNSTGYNTESSNGTSPERSPAIETELAATGVVKQKRQSTDVHRN